MTNSRDESTGTSALLEKEGARVQPSVHIIGLRARPRRAERRPLRVLVCGVRFFTR